MSFVYLDESEAWLTDIMENHYEEALARASSLLARTTTDEKGCMVSDTQVPRKIRFRGRQVAGYRFVYCVLNRAILREDEVVRHRCHDRLCCRVDHLLEGSAADNRLDDHDHWSNGTDHQQRWSRKFGPVVKVDRMKKVMVLNEETKEPFARI